MFHVLNAPLCLVILSLSFLIYDHLIAFFFYPWSAFRVYCCFRVKNRWLQKQFVVINKWLYVALYDAFSLPGNMISAQLAKCF